jgi:hypothetical protein
MPITPNPYFDPEEPADEAIIWRYLSLPKFQDMMANDEFYFCRPDKFSDKAEGIPSEKETARMMGLNPLALVDRRQIDDVRGFAAQIRENYFIMCWTLKKETVRMWGEYAPYGVAVWTRYGKLKAMLNDLLDTANLGKVVYGKKTRPGNLLCEISTKGKDFEWEGEVRAFIECQAFLSGGNLHIDKDGIPRDGVLKENPRHPWIHDHKRRRVDLEKLIEGIVLSPWATPETEREVKDIWTKPKKHTYPVIDSELKSPFAPCYDDYLEKRHLYQ